MKNYKEKFKDPRWQKKRLKILERDQWKCVNCLDQEEFLHVHHLTYEPERYGNPWDYPDGFLIVLCETCHQAAHENKYYLPVRFWNLFCNSLFPSFRARAIDEMDDDIIHETLSEWWGPLV
jgi:5-methylcytosine-specific restriction endonuclease McrA